MIIKNNYAGSSINIEKIDSASNTAYLKLRSENGKACHYYNFIAENEKNMSGFVYIQNIKDSMYYTKDSFSPFVYTDSWKRLSKSNYELTDSSIKFIIPANEIIELSLVPRYTYEDFLNYCNSKNIYLNNDILPKVEFGSPQLPTIFIIGRQHPGETLSSFFIEGIINYILNHPNLINRYHFLIFPIVNIKGVKKGNHRYVDGIDFNRSWNLSRPPSEIQYLKKQLSLLESLSVFIDVHNDELTPKDYIRMNKPTLQEISGIQVLETMSTFKRFMRGLIKQRKIIDISKITAREYVQKNFSCQSMLIELSMNDEVNELYVKGENFIKQICNK